jgi:hypothetical protein
MIAETVGTQRSQNAFAKTLLLAAAITLCGSSATRAAEQTRDSIQLVDQLKTPGIESELSGILPHLTDDGLYYVVTNKRPVYREGQSPMLAPDLRGKLLTVNRNGDVIDVIPLTEQDYGGIAYGAGFLYVAVQDPAEILQVDLKSRMIVAHFDMSGPAGGLEYDRDRDVLYAQLFVGHPHLAVIDPKTHETVKTLWSDESAMGLAKVDGQLLCTWTSGWDPGSFSELRILNIEDGHVTARVPLKAVHSSLAPLDMKLSGIRGFMSLVTTNSSTGETVIQRYRYSHNDASTQ